MLITLAPKSQLYFALEGVLAKQKIYISKEKTNENLFMFNIMQPTIYFDDIQIASIQDISFLSLLLFNKVSINDIQVSNNFKQFAPNKIDDIDISYSITSPQFISIYSSGIIGELNGNIDLISKNIKIILKPSKIIKTKYNKILSMMKKEKGAYKYEYKLR